MSSGRYYSNRTMPPPPQPQSNARPLRLTSLAEWSYTQIASIFEAPSKEDCLNAVTLTFAEHMTGSFNGLHIDRVGVLSSVLNMLYDCDFKGVNVEWRDAVGVPVDPRTDRDGLVGAFYVIHGLKREHYDRPGHPTSYRRQKSVSVRIESQNNDPTVDSRRIVELTFIAVDIAEG